MKKSDLDTELEDLYSDAIESVESSLRYINIALNLNPARLKQKQLPSEFERLIRWRNALEYWKDRFAIKTGDPEVMAEGLGALYEICGQLK